MKNTSRIVSVILKSIIVISAVFGTVISYYAGRDSFMGGRVLFQYSTIQSNIAIAIISLLGLVRILSCKSFSHTARVLRLMGASSITLTGMVFCFVLAPFMNGAWNIQNILTHVVVPIVSVIDFFVDGDDILYPKRDIPFVTVFPILYAIYAGIGYAAGLEFGPGVYYPYFFLNWGSPAGAFGFTQDLPFMGCAWWIILLSLFMLLVGFIYTTVYNKIHRSR